MRWNVGKGGGKEIWVSFASNQHHGMFRNVVIQISVDGKVECHGRGWKVGGEYICI